jgi:hypothetical protein
LIGVIGLFFWSQFFEKDDQDPSPAPAPAVVQTEAPVEIPSVNPEPEPAPEPVSPEPIQPEVVEPELVETEPAPVKPDPVVPEPVVVEPEPEPEPEPVVVAKPKYDVEKFFAHAKSVMQARCDTIIDDHEKALEDNLNSLLATAKVLTRRYLQRKYHEAAARELNKYQNICEKNGNRVGRNLEGKMKFKPYLKELHEKHKEKEAEIDSELDAAFAKEEKTYLYGLGQRVKALEKDDDPVAVEMFKSEIEKVKINPTYFTDLMKEGHK